MRIVGGDKNARSLCTQSKRLRTHARYKTHYRRAITIMYKYLPQRTGTFLRVSNDIVIITRVDVILFRFVRYPRIAFRPSYTNSQQPYTPRRRTKCIRISLVGSVPCGVAIRVKANG